MERLTGLLLDFGRAPGNYLVRLREPRELFDEFDVVAQWALNRIPQALQNQAEDLRAAAVLFIQRACFAPDGTHYQVLGLQQRDYPAEEVRSRYRTMIRLAHPDMGVKGLPPNAASLVNRAHEVLTTPALREKYDEQLNSQVAASPMAAPATAARPITRVVQHPHGWQERFHMLKAQHPKALRAALALGSVAMVVGGVLVWVAQETNDTSRMLIVARPTGARPLAQAEQPAAETSSPRLAMSQDLRVGSTARASLPAPRESAPAQATRTASLAPAPMPARAPAMAAEAPAMPTPGRPAPLPAAPETVALAHMEQARPAPTTAAPAPTPVTTPLAAPAPAARMPAPAAPQPTPATAPAATATPALAPAPAPQAAPALAPAPAPAAPAPAPPVAAPAPPPPPPVVAQQPTAPAWSVDAEGARMYLTDLMTKLENPSEARRVNAYLKNMKVKGSLLSPAIKTLNDRPDLQVRQSHWTESAKPGVLNVQATVLAQPKMPEADPRVLRFRVVAEFHGTAEGTMLAVLDFKETE